MIRSDISKVITERPRTGGSREVTRKAKKKFYNSFDIEEFPTKISMRKIYDYSCRKEFSDLINPLKRAVEKAAREGRSYDEVYSEVKRVLNGNGTLQRHVLQHFHDYIDIPASDGYMYSKNITGRGYRHQSSYSTEFWETEKGVYVNQEGKLVYNQPVEDKWKRDRRNKKEIPKIIEGKEIVKVDGIWYWVLEKRIPQFLTLSHYTYSDKVEYGSFSQRTNYVVAKLSMISKKDLKKYNLN